MDTNSHSDGQSGAHDAASNVTPLSATPEVSEAGATSPPNPELEALQAQVKEKENKYLYLYAEFENYKKRAIKERSDLIKFGWEKVARDLLQTVDNLERALAHTPVGTDKNLVDGLQMVLTQFKSTLQKQGVETIKSLHQPFNPEFHEAIGQEASAEYPSGAIVREEMPGYTLHGRLLRPARVVISTGA
jgi:molecular chaperone GrpE